MSFLELLRFFRGRANTPSRVIGLSSIGVIYAIFNKLDPFLVRHAEILLPVALVGVFYWLFLEVYGAVKDNGLLPVTERDFGIVRERVGTIDRRQTRLADTIGEPYWETDATGRMIFSNHANAQLYGTTARELIRSGTAPYVHKDDLQDAYRQFQQAIQGKMGFSIEFEVVERGVYKHTLRTYAWPLFDDDDVFIGHYGSAEILEEDE